MKVLITGGSSGIGKAAVKKFAEGGHNVVFTYNKSEKEAAELEDKCKAKALKCDVSDPEQVRDAVNEANSILGGIDVLVNNAGIAQIKMICDITDEDWRKMIDVNLSGAFYMLREVSEIMVRQKKGKIINIGSMWGKCGASCEVHYSASKAGIRGLTTAAAKELGPSGITVNCIEPGVIDTEMNKAVDENTIKELCEETPLGRMGKPSEVADAIYFLASDGASFITGQILGVDGGFAI